jgi:hypothetical protein
MSATVILLPQTSRERFSRSMQLGLYGARRDSQPFGDRLDRLVEQIVERAHLALLHRQRFERSPYVDIEHTHGIGARFLRDSNPLKSTTLCGLTSIPILDPIARDDRDPCREIIDRIRRRLAKKSDNGVLNGIGRALAIARDQADSRDDFRVVARDESVQI